MNEWVDSFRSDAEHALKKGHVRDIDFSGSTYQVEVFDPELGESCWPFFQFNDKGEVKDAFCSCPSEDEKCVHIAAAYLKITEEQSPLHIRFERSFWNHICRLFADHCGYEERFLEKKGDQYAYRNEVAFEIRALKADAKKRLAHFLENRPLETPETSIKFSNLSQEDINRWREGRPTQTLRYALSFWSDLAKWMLQQSHKAQISFEEDKEGFPTIITTEFPSFIAKWKVTLSDLELLIPTLETVKAPLQVFESTDAKVRSMKFDARSASLLLEHESLEKQGAKLNARHMQKWAYLPGRGFYPKDGKTLLSRDRISKEEIPQVLEAFAQQISFFIPIHETPLSLSYEMRFDQEWNWHFTAYLFEKHDLLSPDSALIDGWVYLEGKGFYPVQNALFERVEEVLPPSKVSHFVNHHRIWLNGQEGFQTHLASIESHLSYSITENNTLLFHTKTKVDAKDTMDFGDWIYYAGQGFFSKRHARLGLAVRPGLEVNAQNVSQFIKANREELEGIPRFFTTTLPIERRGLELRLKSSSSIDVKPVYTLKAEFSSQDVQLFGDFVYLKEEGFCELPASMRLPEPFQVAKTISQDHLHHFLVEELPHLQKYLLTLDPRLRIPHKSDLEVHYLVRTAGGRLKAQLFYQTEFGKVAATDLLEALEKKKRYFFSEAGLIDLHDEQYQWLYHFKNPIYPESKNLELSTMEFIRFDAMFGFLGPAQDLPMAEVTRNLLKELREFSVRETPNLKGLKSELRLYQQTGVQWLWFLYKNGLSGLLCDDMGLGKTHQAMALIASTLNQKSQEKRRYLVVCPTSVIYHWQDKLETFLPGIKVHTFHGLKRSLKHLPKEGLILTTYGILRMEKKKLEEIPFDVAVFDEVQVAKNPQSRVHEALLHVNTRMRLGLTGTPIENNLRELKSLFDIVLPGYMPGETRYRELFINPIERDLDEEKKALLSQMIRPFILRRRKSEVLQELPEKSEDKSYCDLSEEQTKLYRETLEKTSLDLISELRDREAKVNYIHVFSLLSRLKQVCDHPALVLKDPKNYKAYSSGKWELFVELLEEARDSEQKVVVFSQYLYMLDIIENYLKERNWGYAQIRGDTINRREELKRFQEDPECVVFIGSLQAAGLGIDLTAASVVMLYDRWWNAARENQAIDRVHRIGQKWGVQVYKLITKNTIEEKIDRMITRKGRLLEEIVTADDQAVLKKFSRSELIELLSFHEHFD